MRRRMARRRMARKGNEGRKVENEVGFNGGGECCTEGKSIRRHCLWCWWGKEYYYIQDEDDASIVVQYLIRARSTARHFMRTYYRLVSRT